MRGNCFFRPVQDARCEFSVDWPLELLRHRQYLVSRIEGGQTAGNLCRLMEAPTVPPNAGLTADTRA